MFINDDKYHFIRGSDIIRDGMYLELCKEEANNQLLQIAEVFYSDETSVFSLTCFIENVPLPLIEELMKRAKAALPPVVKTTHSR